ncbi:Josephin-1 [Coemansia spiralis]|uniref:ubiquitinyl hydrolase 1 n=1 Tax=Coemansia spiralis TaxID=417178 RepID=A0A9W8L0K7_9FUNG|nr:Josephin-1 [Coemansia spiralis]
MKLRDSPIYHEKQSFWLCAKHSLNNVLQQELYSHADLERIAKYLHELHPEQTGWLKFNSHKNFLGFGDYDVNVITSALQEHGYDLLWHDNRSDIEEADLSNSVGLIVHIQPDWFFRRGHWFAIKHFNQVLTTPVVPVTYVGQPRAARSSERGSHEYDAKSFEPGFWNLDSRLVHPEHIGDRDGLNEFLRQLSKRNRVHVLLIVPLNAPSTASLSS